MKRTIEVLIEVENDDDIQAGNAVELDGKKIRFSHLRRLPARYAIPEAERLPFVLADMAAGSDRTHYMVKGLKENGDFVLLEGAVDD